MESINWTDQECMISRHFKVREAVYLSRWDRLATEEDGLTDESKDALVFLFQKMDAIRDFIGVPIIVHCAFRPEKYNELVGGAQESAHMARMVCGLSVAAIDWHAAIEGQTQGEGCDTIRASLMPMLETWGMRMEDNGHGAAWIHLDTKPISFMSPHRYFKP